MNTLEPLCTGEQTEMLQQLGLNVLIDPTISLAKNWLYDKYRLWITLDRFDCMKEGRPITAFYPLCTSVYEHEKVYIDRYNGFLDPHTAESVCLTEVLKKLTSEKSNS